MMQQQEKPAPLVQQQAAVGAVPVQQQATMQQPVAAAPMAATYQQYGQRRTKQQYVCLFTRHKTQKHKVWHDGVLVVNGSGASLYRTVDGATASLDPSLLVESMGELSPFQLNQVQLHASGRNNDPTVKHTLEMEHYLVRVEATAAAPPQNKKQRTLGKKFQRPARILPNPTTAAQSVVPDWQRRRVPPLQPGQAHAAAMQAAHPGSNYPQQGVPYQHANMQQPPSQQQALSYHQHQYPPQQGPPVYQQSQPSAAPLQQGLPSQAPLQGQPTSYPPSAQHGTAQNTGGLSEQQQHVQWNNNTTANNNSQAPLQEQSFVNNLPPPAPAYQQRPQTLPPKNAPPRPNQFCHNQSYNANNFDGEEEETDDEQEEKSAKDVWNPARARTENTGRNDPPDAASRKPPPQSASPRPVVPAPSLPAEPANHAPPAAGVDLAATTTTTTLTTNELLSLFGGAGAAVAEATGNAVGPPPEASTVAAAESAKGPQVEAVATSTKQQEGDVFTLPSPDSGDSSSDDDE